jgi:hypothetical protein
MFRIRFARFAPMLALLVLLALVAAGCATTISADALAQDAGETVAVEVAEDLTRLTFTKDYLFDDGLPGAGTGFVTYGYIYPEGTLNGSNGVLPDGSPEFPDKVLGEWICSGWMIRDGAHTPSGPYGVTEQLFQFNEAYDNAAIVTYGFEKADLNTPFGRVIEGGTGQFAAVQGEQQQTLLTVADDLSGRFRMEFRFAE